MFTINLIACLSAPVLMNFRCLLSTALMNVGNALIRSIEETFCVSGRTTALKGDLRSFETASAQTDNYDDPVFLFKH